MYPASRLRASPAFRKAAGPLLVLCAGLALVGCSAMDPMGKQSPEAPNRITFTPIERDHDVRFVGNTANPNADEAMGLQEFIRRNDVRDGDKISISTDTSTLGQQRRARVMDMLSRAGLTQVSDAPAPVIPNTVTVIVRQQIAVAPTCPAWPTLGSGDVLNAPSRELGCATASNLYQMVVDKRDLAAGRKPGPADAEPAMRAVQTYREGKSPLESGGASPIGGGGNPAGDSAIAAATGAAGLANTGTGAAGSSSSTGSTNGK